MPRMKLPTIPSPKAVIFWGCVIVSGVAFCAAVLGIAWTRLLITILIFPGMVVSGIIGGIDASDSWYYWLLRTVQPILTKTLVVLFNLVLFSVPALAVAGLCQMLTFVGLPRKPVQRITSFLLIGWLIFYLLALLVLFVPDTFP